MDNTIAIGENFTMYDVQYNEWATRLRIDNTVQDNAVVENAHALATKVLDPLRAEVSFHITSWYRCEALERDYQRNAFARWCIANRKHIDDNSWREFFADKQQHATGQAVTIAGRGLDSIFEFVRDRLDYDVLQHKTHWLSISYAPNNRKRVVTA